MKLIVVVVVFLVLAVNMSKVLNFKIYIIHIFYLKGSHQHENYERSTQCAGGLPEGS